MTRFRYLVADGGFKVRAEVLLSYFAPNKTDIILHSLVASDPMMPMRSCHILKLSLFVIISKTYAATATQDCFEEQSAIKQYISKPYSYSVHDATECQQKCQEREECGYFQFSLHTFKGKNCYLKTKNAERHVKPNNCCVFGPKHCETNSETEPDDNNTTFNDPSINVTVSCFVGYCAQSYGDNIKRSIDEVYTECQRDAKCNAYEYSEQLSYGKKCTKPDIAGIAYGYQVCTPIQKCYCGNEERNRNIIICTVNNRFEKLSCELDEWCIGPKNIQSAVEEKRLCKKVTFSCGGDELYPNCSYCTHGNKANDADACRGNCHLDASTGYCKPKNNFVMKEHVQIDSSNIYRQYDRLNFAELACENDSKCIGIFDASCDEKGPFLLFQKGYMTSYRAPNCIYKKKRYELDSKCFDVSMHKHTANYGWSFGNCSHSSKWLGTGTYTDKCCVVGGKHILDCRANHGEIDWSGSPLIMLGHQFCDDVVGQRLLIAVNVSELVSTSTLEEKTKEIAEKVYNDPGEPFTCSVGLYCVNSYGRQMFKTKLEVQNICLEDSNCNAIVYSSSYGHGILCSSTASKPTGNGWEKCDIARDCKTDDGHKPCIFPYYYGGVRYTTCTTVGNNGTYWCAIAVDNEGQQSHEDWGNCDNACSRASANDYSLDVSLLPRTFVNDCPINSNYRARFGTCSCDKHCSWDLCRASIPLIGCLLRTESMWMFDSLKNAWVAQHIKEVTFKGVPGACKGTKMMVKYPKCEDADSSDPICNECQNICKAFKLCTGYTFYRSGQNKGDCFLKRGKLTVQTNQWTEKSMICYEKVPNTNYTTRLTTLELDLGTENSLATSTFSNQYNGEGYQKKHVPKGRWYELENMDIKMSVGLLTSLGFLFIIYLLFLPRKVLNEPKILLGRIKVIFDVICFLLALYMTVKMIGRYYEDRNSTSIAYKKYSDSLVNQYPVFSICFKGDRLYRFNETAIFTAYWIHSTDYEMMLNGYPAFQYEYDPTTRLYSKIQVHSKLKTDIRYNNMAQNSFQLSDIVKQASFLAENEYQSTFYGNKEAIAAGSVVTEPPLYISYRSPRVTCLTRKSSYEFDLIRVKDSLAWDTSFLDSNTRVQIFIHHPGQLTRSFDSPSFTSYLKDIRTLFSHTFLSECIKHA